MKSKILQHRYFDRYFASRELLCAILPEILERLYRARPRSEEGLAELDRFCEQIVSVAADFRPDDGEDSENAEARREAVREELKARRLFYDENLPH